MPRLGLGLQLSRRKLLNSIAGLIKCGLLSLTTPEIDKVGKQSRPAVVGETAKGDLNTYFKFIELANNALTYKDAVTDLDVSSAFDANGEFVIPSNGIKALTTDYNGSTYALNPSSIDSNGIVTLYNIDDNTDFILGQQFNAPQDPREENRTQISIEDMYGLSISDGVNYYYDRFLETLVPDGTNMPSAKNGKLFTHVPSEKGNIVTEVFPIHVNPCTFDMAITNADNPKWYFEDGTLVEGDQPNKVLSTAQTVYLTCDDFSKSNIELNDNNVNSAYVGDLGDFPLLTRFASFNNCTNLTGDIYNLGNLTRFASFDNCTNLTGDIYNLGNLTYFASFVNCTNLTGILDPNPSLKYLYLNNTGMSVNDVDQTVINLDNNTNVTGTLNISGLQRSSVSDNAINSLITKGWSVTDATVV